MRCASLLGAPRAVPKSYLKFVDMMRAAYAGLETFGVKLAEASKLFGKKFASGASITKNAMEKDQIEVRQFSSPSFNMSRSHRFWHTSSDTSSDQVTLHLPYYVLRLSKSMTGPRSARRSAFGRDFHGQYALHAY